MRDVAERVLEVPLPLEKALAKSKAARANWARLSYTHQKEWRVRSPRLKRKRRELADSKKL